MMEEIAFNGLGDAYDGKTSYRRWLLNRHLDRVRPLFEGANVVIDVGGRRIGRSKEYSYPYSKAGCWKSINISEADSPDVVGNANKLPFATGIADVVICTEVLEHLTHPEACLMEIERVLADGGVFIGSAPFVFPVHGDPSDYFRFTREGLLAIMPSFKTIDIAPMGGSLGTIGLTISQELQAISRSKIVQWCCRNVAFKLCRIDSQRLAYPECRLPTGWFWVARK